MIGKRRGSSLYEEKVHFCSRPVAGNINICPGQLRGDHHSIDFDRFVSTIKHEILHTLVMLVRERF